MLLGIFPVYRAESSYLTVTCLWIDHQKPIAWPRPELGNKGQKRMRKAKVYCKTQAEIDTYPCAPRHFSRVQLLANLWTGARQAPLSLGFSRQEYWSGLPRPPPEDLPDPDIKPASPAWQADSLPLSHLGSPCIYELYTHILHTILCCASCIHSPCI